MQFSLVSIKLVDHLPRMVGLSPAAHFYDSRMKLVEHLPRMVGLSPAAHFYDSRMKLVEYLPRMVGLSPAAHFYDSRMSCIVLYCIALGVSWSDYLSYFFTFWHYHPYSLHVFHTL